MKLILFDLDGTLVSTGGVGVRAMDRAFLSLQRLPRASDGVAVAGRTDPAIFRDVFRTKLRREPLAQELKDLEAHYVTCLQAEMDLRPGYRVMEGVEELLGLLAARADVFLALGTGNIEAGARIKLEPVGLNRFFSVGGFGSDHEDRPEVLRHAVRRASEKAGRPFAGREVVVVGDTVHDVTAGKAIGAATLAVSNGHVPLEELRAASPDVLVETLKDPAPLLSLLA